ncbi:MAG: NAD(P)-dependent oxidoreductase [Mycobacterium sp.]|nr:NAD(P)-dependent oxidoreductase [Mycobacterium sp.]
MKAMAVIGAGGYVGARLVERSVLLGDPPLVPIVRTWRSQGRLARYGVRTVRGDAGDTDSLVPALRGCGMAVNLTTGDNNRILGDTKSIHAACHQAGVPLLVHMSSAEVFGRAEATGLTEDSAPDGRHWMEYGRAKAAAEAWLRSQSAGPVKVVILRPGLIWGPGSGWLVRPAQALLDGTAFLFDEGRGICNLIHVDNLIAYLMQLARADRVESAVYNISDAETLTWAGYYRAIAEQIGVDASTVPLLPQTAFRESPVRLLLHTLGNQAPARAVKRRMSDDAKRRIKQGLRDLRSPPPAASRLIVPRPEISKQFWWIQGTARKLPSGGFAQRYPGTSLRSFNDLMAEAGEWLRYAGFQSD